jgi:hypothetical protein
LRLFHQPVRQHHDITVHQESKQPIGVRGELDSALPNLVGTRQLLEIRYRDNVQIFQQSKDPGDFLRRFAGQSVKKVFYGAFSFCRCVENDGAFHSLTIG